MCTVGDIDRGAIWQVNERLGAVPLHVPCGPVVLAEAGIPDQYGEVIRYLARVRGSRFEGCRNCSPGTSGP